MLFPEPAVDTVGRRIVGPGHHDVWRSRVRDIPEFAGELPAATMREEIETPGDGQIRAMVTIAGNPVLSTPDGRGLARAFDGLDFMVAIDIYLNETTRQADVILPPTSALERDQYDLVFHGFAVRNTAQVHARGLRQARRRAARLGDLRGARRPAPGSPRRRAEGPAGDQGPVRAEPGDHHHRAAQDRRPHDDAGAAQEPRGRRPRPAAPDHARAAPDRRQADRPDARTARRRPRPRRGGTRRHPGRRFGRAAAHRPPAPAGLQLLAAQHPAADPREAAAPPAHAPEGPRGPRPRGRRRRSRQLASRQRGRRGERASTT